MPKFILVVITFVLSFTLSAQNISEETDIETSSAQVKNVIETFFDALHKGDSTLMKTTLHKDIKIQTTNTNNKGEKLLQTESRLSLLTSIANKKAETIYEEKLLSFDIKIDGNLASVWTPYEFYLNGKFSHCGANSFQLFNNNGTWEIIYLVDMRRRENCKALNEKK